MKTHLLLVHTMLVIIAFIIDDEVFKSKYFSGRRARVIDGFDGEGVNNFVDTGVSDQF